MEKFIVKDIKITNLLLNVENPRFEAVVGQRDALEKMITEIGNKLFSLAEDIIDHGLNPSELVIAVQEDDKHNHRVLEGNRRIAALKLLSNPEIFKDKHKSFTKKISKLAKKWNKNSIKEVQCVVFNNADDANRWIELKHTGENKGRGVVSWDGQQTARFNSIREGQKSIGLQVIDFLGSSCGSDIEKILKKVSITNLERLLTDKNVQSVLGIQIKDGTVESNLLRDETKKGLLKIVNDIAAKKVKVIDIYTKDARKKYIETFKPTIDIPDGNKQAASSWQLSSDHEKPTSHKKVVRKSALPTERNELIPRNCILHINETKINKIYTELKDIDVNEFTNAVAVLFRVFLELSIDAFNDKYNLPKSKNGKLISLRERLKTLAKYMEDEGMATNNELKGARVIASEKDGSYSVDTFNDFVHNRHFSPISSNLKSGWNNLQIFVEKLWSNV